jgi:hypothetical protein
MFQSVNWELMSIQPSPTGMDPKVSVSDVVQVMVEQGRDDESAINGHVMITLKMCAQIV